jgi:hypothetical protein
MSKYIQMHGNFLLFISQILRFLALQDPLKMDNRPYPQQRVENRREAPLFAQCRPLAKRVIQAVSDHASYADEP